MADEPTVKARRSWLERFLGVFADVMGGEGLLVVIFTLNVFLLLMAYSVLKPIREGLIQNASLFGIEGAELKSYLGAVMALVLVFVVKGYGALGSKVDRLRLLNLTTMGVIACVVVFFLLFRVFKVSGPEIAVAYYVWLGCVGAFIVAQFWSYSNDVYTEKQGKRLFAIIAVGQSTGAIAGAYLTSAYGKQYMELLLLSAGFLLVGSLVLYNIANGRVAIQGTGDADKPTKETEPQQPLSKDGGFQLIMRSRYLLAIAFMILIATLFNTNGEYLIGTMYGREANKFYPKDMFTETWVAEVNAGTQPVPSEIAKDDVKVITDDTARTAKIGKMRKGYGTSFFGSFQLWVNIAGALIQLLLVSRIFKYLGVRGALFILPVIATTGSVFFGIVGTLAAIRTSKTAENSLDYSLQNTVKQALFLPTTREEKYKAKAATDTFFFRVGDASSAAMVALATHVMFLSVRQFALANAVLGVAWLALCVVIYREHKRKVPDDVAKKLPG